MQPTFKLRPEFQYVSQVVAFSTLLDTFQIGLSLATPKLDGTFKIVCQWWLRNNGDAEGTIRCYNVTDAEDACDEMSALSNDDPGILMEMFSEVVFTGAAKVLELQLKTTDVAVEQTMLEMGMALWRVDV